ncbi:MAG: molybdopterin-dependent oxidoreductase [Gammaproteobacteria bacterium]|nr:molybdopterin-dependent oxidoreductase [Gammaproteobacteria bacterium]MDE2251137.1 molybdopterin-dependent oxidoreductase [Gammaproteobacteria bacterium]
MVIRTRRSLLQTALGGLGLLGAGLSGPLARAGLPAGTLASAVLDALAGKRPLLKRSYRPPNYESPVSYLNEVITPNDRFFVRWHLADIPTIDVASWRLSIGGDGASRPFELTLAQLQHEFEPVELTAVCQCAGNRRGLSDPHVPGVQWGNGAMGNARWKGARLKDLLARAGLAKEAVEIAFNGADGPVLEATPDFTKSIPAWKALDENTLVAYEMNGEPLPHWNGYPARIIVPGWTATYWMKQVVSIRALAQPLSSFWMNTAYRIPKGKFPVVDRFLSQESETTTPVTEILVNSLITNLEEGQRFRAGSAIVVQGLAWDGGAGLRRVEVSIDGGRSWQSAQFGADLGRYSARAWQYAFTPRARGRVAVAARASNAQGATQTEQLIFNPAGYYNNVIQPISLEVT